MKKLLLLSVVIASLMMAGSAHAGTDTNWPNRWVKIAELNGDVYYYDNYDNVQKHPSSKLPNGNRGIRILVDIPLKDGVLADGRNSSTVSYEFNCKKKQYRITDITDFADNMASGAPSQGGGEFEDENEWSSLNNVTTLFYNLACKG